MGKGVSESWHNYHFSIPLFFRNFAFYNNAIFNNFVKAQIIED